MPRYSDDWVISKSLFEYTTGGSCQCCAFPAIFDPNGLKGLISSVSDLETDAANEEFNAAQQSPWPPEMRDSVWADRVRVRHKLKKEMKSRGATFVLKKDFTGDFEISLAAMTSPENFKTLQEQSMSVKE